MSVIIKPNITNIISLWFSVDTPLRQYKITLNENLWATCQTVSRTFRPPSGIGQIEKYRHADKMAFARAVQQQIELSR